MRKENESFKKSALHEDVFGVWFKKRLINFMLVFSLEKNN